MIYDISMPIHADMPVYKNKDSKKPRFERQTTYEEKGVNETRLSMNLHTGTHIDFPLHAIDGGATSNGHDLNTMIGPAKVYDLMHLKDHIGLSDIETLDIKQNDFVLFKTKNSLSESFDFKFIYLDQEAARYLAKKKIRGVGIDALGIERDQENHPTHKRLLEEDIIILEGINLKAVPEDNYEMICLPLSIRDVEALPVRAILRK